MLALTGKLVLQLLDHQVADMQFGILVPYHRLQGGHIVGQDRGDIRHDPIIGDTGVRRNPVIGQVPVFVAVKPHPSSGVSSFVAERAGRPAPVDPFQQHCQLGGGDAYLLRRR